MLLDNLFSILGIGGTSAILFAIVALLGMPAAATVMCRGRRGGAYARLQRSR